MTDKQLGPADYRGQPVNVCQEQEFKAFNTRDPGCKEPKIPGNVRAFFDVGDTEDKNRA